MAASSELSDWLATPQGRRTAIIGGVVVTSVVAVGLIVFGLNANAAKPKQTPGKRGVPGFIPTVARGRILCPREIKHLPINPQSIRPNDFVVLRIIADDQSFTEQVWAHVLSVSPDKSQFHVEITASMIATGLSPISTDKHGFTIGEKIKIDSDCVFDLLPTPVDYQIICGVLLEDLGYQGAMNYEGAKEILPVNVGDMVTLVVGNRGVSASALPGHTWNEAIRVSVTSTGKTGSIIHGLVWDEPERTEHGLHKMSKVAFTRDCIVKD